MWGRGEVQVVSSKVKRNKGDWWSSGKINRGSYLLNRREGEGVVDIVGWKRRESRMMVRWFSWVETGAAGRGEEGRDR